MQSHSYDLISVISWVKELQDNEFNPTVLYKLQGDDILTIGTSSSFSKEYFVVAIKTKFQLEKCSRSLAIIQFVLTPHMLL